VSDTNLQIFLLCLVVFLISAIFLCIVLIYVYKLEASSIQSGVLDEDILRITEQEKKKSKSHKILSNLFSFLMLGIVSGCFIFGLTTYVTNYDVVGDLPSYKVVRSESMQAKNENNTYLVENNLDNQISMYDLVTINKLPDEYDLKLYDIVVYQTVTNDLVIHRIVKIEEPNENHPDCRLFTFQGDNVSTPDGKLVYYTQMKGIYSNYKIPYVGKIVMFFQSYAGYLCVGITVFYVIISPLLEKKQDKMINERVSVIYSSREKKEEEAA